MATQSATEGTERLSTVIIWRSDFRELIELAEASSSVSDDGMLVYLLATSIRQSRDLIIVSYRFEFYVCFLVGLTYVGL